MTKPMQSLTAVLTLAVGLSAAAALAEAPIHVTHAGDDGAGSLRAALVEAAATGAASRIVMLADGPITLSETLIYDGTDPLEIIGAGNSILARGNFTLFAATRGADLTLRDLLLSGPGDFGLEARGDLDGPAGRGIVVDLRDGQQGLVTLTLSHVAVYDVAGHGIHVSDCNLAESCDAGGSPASVAVRMTDSLVENAGNGRFDADGLRVDERGPGDITVFLSDATFTGIGADGVGLDEAQDGDVTVTVIQSLFEFNGNYCAPEIMAAFLPDRLEDDFEEGERTEAAIPGPVSGSPDDACVRREVTFHGSGMVAAYEFDLDLDDGFDIDETGDGSVRMTMVGSLIRGNSDEGLDLDEDGAGDMSLTIVRSAAEGNGDDGFNLSESGEGDITATLFAARAFQNEGNGAVFEESDSGDLRLDLIGMLTFENDDGDETGLEVEQQGTGTGRVTLTGSTFSDGIDTEGVAIEIRD